MARPPYGTAPSFALPKECNTVSVHLPFAAGANWKTTPQPMSPLLGHVYLPPSYAVPRRLPLLSKTRPEETYPPPTLLRSKKCRTVSIHLPSLRGVSLKAVPQLEGPPKGVVPYKSPEASKTKRPYPGSDPSVWSKECRTASVHLPSTCGLGLKTVPQP